tara:strand:+ start:7547 stop:7699 length:153 start_codon:yes stop_codon:yes gene_type:complete
LNDILEMEFVIALKLGITPNPLREFFELNWFYERYVAFQQEIEATNQLQM